MHQNHHIHAPIIKHRKHSSLKEQLQARQRRIHRIKAFNSQMDTNLNEKHILSSTRADYKFKGNFKSKQHDKFSPRTSCNSDSSSINNENKSCNMNNIISIQNMNNTTNNNNNSQRNNRNNNTYHEKFQNVTDIMVMVGHHKKGMALETPERKTVTRHSSPHTTTETSSDRMCISPGMQHKKCMFNSPAVSCIAERRSLCLTPGSCPLCRKAATRSSPGGSLCKVCFSKPINTVLIRCGHVCVCMECSNHLERCPICRSSIEEVIRTYKA